MLWFFSLPLTVNTLSQRPLPISYMIQIPTQRTSLQQTLPTKYKFFFLVKCDNAKLHLQTSKSSLVCLVNWKNGILHHTFATFPPQRAFTKGSLSSALKAMDFSDDLRINFAVQVWLSSISKGAMFVHNTYWKMETRTKQNWDKIIKYWNFYKKCHKIL